MHGVAARAMSISGASPSVGPRVYYCDRSACKRFWSNTAIANHVGNGELPVQELLPLVSTTIERVLQPV